MDYLGRLLGRVYGELPVVQPDLPPVFGADEPEIEHLDSQVAAFYTPRMSPRPENAPAPAMNSERQAQTAQPTPTESISQQNTPPVPPPHRRPLTSQPEPSTLHRAESMPNGDEPEPAARETHIERLTERVLRIETVRDVIEHETIHERETLTSATIVEMREGKSTPVPVARPTVTPNLPPDLPLPAPAVPMTAPRETTALVHKVINVRIGRIEVRPSAPPAPASTNNPRRKPAGISLDDYLRGGGKS